MRSRDAEIIAITEQINGLLDELARTVADMNAVLNHRPGAVDHHTEAQNDR